MIFAISKFIAGLFGWDISRVQRYVVWALLGLILLIILAIGLWFKSCMAKHNLKVSQQQVEKINHGNEVEKKQELQKVIDDNADMVKTVDNRTALTDADIYDRQHASQQRIAEAEKQIDAAHAQGRDVTQEELECLLVPDHCSH